MKSPQALYAGDIDAYEAGENYMEEIYFHQIHEPTVLKLGYNEHLLTTSIFTVRNSSCGKVMFSQASVCPQGVSGSGSGGVHTPLGRHPPARHFPGRHPPSPRQTPPPPPRRPLQRTVCTLLECVLVSLNHYTRCKRNIHSMLQWL